MEEADVFAAVTSRPAAILQRPEALGSLESGAPADLVALQISVEPVTLSDVYGNQLQGFQWVPVCTVRNGRVVYLSDDARVDQQPAG
jgi:imidazolonepropionase-like amidohydrolase